MKTFEKPLTAQEEDCYIRMLQEKESEKAQMAKEILIKHNLRLVAHIAKKYQNVDEDPEDMISIGTIGLIKAIDSFDCNKGRLATYACRCIENELLMMLRSKKKTSKEVSLYEPIGTDKEGNEISLLDVIEQQQFDVVKQMELSENIRRMYSLFNEKLSEREKTIIYLRYGIFNGEEKTQYEIGQMLGISRSYVSRIEKKALGKMQKGFAEAGIFS